MTCHVIIVMSYHVRTCHYYRMKKEKFIGVVTNKFEFFKAMKRTGKGKQWGLTKYRFGFSKVIKGLEAQKS